MHLPRCQMIQRCWYFAWDDRTDMTFSLPGPSSKALLYPKTLYLWYYPPQHYTGQNIKHLTFGAPFAKVCLGFVSGSLFAVVGRACFCLDIKRFKEVRHGSFWGNQLCGRGSAGKFSGKHLAEIKVFGWEPSAKCVWRGWGQWDTPIMHNETRCRLQCFWAATSGKVIGEVRVLQWTTWPDQNVHSKWLRHTGWEAN